MALKHPRPSKVEIRIIRTHNLSALLIHLGMWIYAILRLKKPKKSYNHVEVVYGYGEGSMLTSGAIGKGVTTRKWAQYRAKYHAEGKYFKAFPYRVYLSLSEWNAGKEYLDSVEGRKYEYSNFFYHAIRIFTGIWAGDRTDRQAYCLEHAIRFLNATGKYNLDVYISPYEFEAWADKNLCHD